MLCPTAPPPELKTLKRPPEKQNREDSTKAWVRSHMTFQGQGPGEGDLGTLGHSLGIFGEVQGFKQVVMLYLGPLRRALEFRPSQGAGT